MNFERRVGIGSRGKSGEGSMKVQQCLGNRILGRRVGGRDN